MISMETRAGAMGRSPPWEHRLGKNKDIAHRKEQVTQTKEEQMHTITKHRRTLALAVLIAAPVLVSGCTATRGRRGAPEESGFLRDYSQLAEVEGYPAARIYIRPGVQWSRYNAIQLDSVGLYTDASTANLSPEDQQMLTDMLYKSLYEDLSKYFTIVDHAGPNTLRLRVALTQAQGAKPVLRTVTTVVPQLRVLGSIVGLAGDTAATVGSATVEMEVLDSDTNQRLAAAVDDRAGTKVLFAKRAYSTWGDVQAACGYWGGRITWQLARHGVQLKPGAGMPEEPKESRTI